MCWSMGERERVRSRERGVVQMSVLLLLLTLVLLMPWLLRIREKIRYRRIAWYVATGHRDAVACEPVELLLEVSVWNGRAPVHFS